MSAFEVAKEICERLFAEGFIAYFAGGWVRDLLLGRRRAGKAEEIDIATTAPPTTIQALFPKTIPVGIAFGVVIVVEGEMQFEVTTFRKDHPSLDGRHPEGIDFSSPEKDAQRRDFTVNGLFYDPLTEMIYDYVEGRKDLERQVIRAIGEPEKRFEEDRLRMLRAVRFTTQLGFTLEKQTAEAIAGSAEQLFPAVSIERVWQELSKMTRSGQMDKAVLLLHELKLLATLFPALKDLPRSLLEERICPFVYYPPETPTIFYLTALFPNASLEEKLSLCRYLKTPAIDQKRVTFFHKAEELFADPKTDPYAWAHFYAHPLAPLFLSIQAANILPPERGFFLATHEERQNKLFKAIERIQKQNPLVRAIHLQERGIIPGKQMGLLLKRAEQIAINENLEERAAILERLHLDAPLSDP